MKINNLTKKLLLIIIAIMMLSAVVIPTVALATTENGEVEITGIENKIGENTNKEPEKEEPAKGVDEQQPEKEESTEELAEEEPDEEKLGKLEGLKKLLKIFQFKLEDKNLVLKVDGKEVNVDADAGATVGLVMENGELGVKVGNGAARFGKFQIINNGEGTASVNLKNRSFSGQGSVNILDRLTIGGNGSISFDINLENYELLVSAEGGAIIGSFSIPANGTASISLDLSQDRLLNKIQIKLVSASIFGHDINVDFVNGIVDFIKNLIIQILDRILGVLRT